MAGAGVTESAADTESAPPVQMKVIPMRGVVVGSQRRGEQIAGTVMYGAQELAIGVVIPMRRDRDPLAV